MNIPKISFGVMVTILATGALLNIAGSGRIGAFPQKLAQYVTKGYGV